MRTPWLTWWARILTSCVQWLGQRGGQGGDAGAQNVDLLDAPACTQRLRHALGEYFSAVLAACKDLGVPGAAGQGTGPGYGGEADDPPNLGRSRDKERWPRTDFLSGVEGARIRTMGRTG
jgi:hypothetical protein